MGGGSDESGNGFLMLPLLVVWTPHNGTFQWRVCQVHQLSLDPPHTSERAERIDSVGDKGEDTLKLQTMQRRLRKE